MAYMPGMTRKLDVLGRIVIPASIRKNLKLQEGDTLEIGNLGRVITITPVKGQCVVCGEDDPQKLIPHEGIHVCVTDAANLGTKVGLK